MHAALLANSDFLNEELHSFRHLVVGMLDEQVNIAQVIPKSKEDIDIGPMCEVLYWSESNWAILRRKRLMELTTSLRRLGIDLIHALDRQLWDAAVHVAAQLEIPVILNSWSVEDLSYVGRVRQAVHSGAAAFVAPSGPIAQGIIGKLNLDAVVEVIPPGVHLADERPAPDDDDERQLCLVISGSGTLDEDYDTLLQAIKNIVADYPQTHIFMDGWESDQHSLWPAIKRLELDSHLSMLPRGLKHRELLLEGDALIHPDIQGRYRGLSLQAMAHGLPVIAREDPWIDHFIDDKTAWVITDSTVERWESTLRRLVEDPERTAKLRKSCRQWIAQNRLASEQVTRTLDLYRRITGESIRFPGNDAAVTPSGKP